MVRKIEFVAKTIEIGNSIGITIPKDVRDVLGLGKGNYLQVSVERIEKEDLKKEGE